MTLTPIICYYGQASKIDPTPYLVAEFMAANIWSMLFFFGNPTNIIVFAAFDLTFFGYTAWVLLPTLSEWSVVVHVECGATDVMPGSTC